MSGMAGWAKMAANLDRNPKVRAAGADAREVFLFFLRVNRDLGTDGSFPSLYGGPAYLAEVLMRDVTHVTLALARGQEHGLFEISPEAVRIVGWDDDWRSPKTAAQRVREHRERKRAAVTRCNEVKRDETRVTARGEERRGEEKRREKKKSSSPVAPISPAEAVELAELLATRIGERLPTSKAASSREACVRRWASDLDKLSRIDGHAWPRIREVLEWSQRDPFWQGNILSGGKLREKFDTLAAQMARPSGGVAVRPPAGLSAQQIWDLAQTMRAEEAE